MKVILAFLTVILLTPIFGQNPKQSFDTFSKAQMRVAPLIDNSKETEAYKLLYETAQKSNEALRETMHWTIGIVIGFILLILGSQFLYNWRLNKQEVETIRSEMETRFQELQNALLKEKEQLFNQLKENIAVAQKENREYLRERYSTYRELNTSQMEMHKKEVERELKQMKGDIEKNNGEIWLLKGVDANALSSFIKTAIYKLETNHELKYIFEDIIRLLSKSEEIYQTDFNDLDKLIKGTREKHGTKYNHDIGEIEKNYKGKPVYVYEDNSFAVGPLNALIPGGFLKKIVKK